MLVLGGDGLSAGLSEDRGDQGARRLGASRAQPGGDVVGEVDPTPLPGGAGQDRLDRGADAGVGVAGDQYDPWGPGRWRPSVPARAGTAGRRSKSRWSQRRRAPCLGSRDVPGPRLRWRRPGPERSLGG